MKKNNRGFTLVEIMIAAAMLGGLSLALMQLKKGSLQTQGDAVSMADYVQLQKEISFIISDSNSCMVSLAGVTFNGSTIRDTPKSGLELWSAAQPIPTPPALPIRSQKKIYESQVFGKISIGSISFTMPDYMPSPQIPTNWVLGTGQSSKAELKISGNKLNMGKTKTFPNILQSINVTFDTNAAGLSTIKSCNAASIVASAAPSSKQYFPTSGSFTVPSGVTIVFVSMAGGGGGGAGKCTGTGNGGPGASAEIYFSAPIAVTPGSIIPITIGAPGTGGSSYACNGYQHYQTRGHAGTASSFGTYLVAAGGAGGAAGQGCYDDYTGTSDASANLFGKGGAGGIPGGNGVGFGAGGGGGAGFSGCAAGGEGKSGAVIVEW